MKDQWGDEIEDGDTVITLVDDPDAPGGVRPVLWVMGVDTPPAKSVREDEEMSKLSDDFKHRDLLLVAEGERILDEIEKRKPKLGTGARFAALEGALGERGASNPKALAAWIGRKKYGKKRFASLGGKKGKKKSAGPQS